jgi:hypothetical protein
MRIDGACSISHSDTNDGYFLMLTIPFQELPITPSKTWHKRIFIEYF